MVRYCLWIGAAFLVGFFVPSALVALMLFTWGVDLETSSRAGLAFIGFAVGVPTGRVLALAAKEAIDQ